MRSFKVVAVPVLLVSMCLLYLSPSAYTAEKLFNPKVVSANTVDMSSLQTIVSGIRVKYGVIETTPGRQTAEAIWRYCLSASAYGGWPLYHGPEWCEFPYMSTMDGNVHDPIKTFNCYGWALCTCYAPTLEALYQAAGFQDARVWFLSGHSVCEVFYDGSYHHFDSDNEGFNVANNSTDLATGRVVSSREIMADGDQIMRKGGASWEHPEGDAYYTKAFLKSSPWYPFDVQAGAVTDLARLFTTTSDNFVYTGDQFHGGHTMDIALRPGESITRNFYNVNNPGSVVDFYSSFVFNVNGYEQDLKLDPNYPQYGPEYGPFCTRDSRSYGSGVDNYTVDLTSSGDITKGMWGSDDTRFNHDYAINAAAPYIRPSAAATTSEVTFYVRLPYVLFDATVTATFVRNQSADVAKAYISVDNGLHWTLASTVSQTGTNIVQTIPMPILGAKGTYVVNGNTYNEIDDLRLVSGRYGFLVKFELRGSVSAADVGLKALSMATKFMNNPRSLPELTNGNNTMTFSLGDQTEVMEIRHDMYSSQSAFFDALYDKDPGIAWLAQGSILPSNPYVDYGYDGHYLVYEVDPPGDADLTRLSFGGCGGDISVYVSPSDTAHYTLQYSAPHKNSLTWLDGDVIAYDAPVGPYPNGPSYYQYINNFNKDVTFSPGTKKAYVKYVSNDASIMSRICIYAHYSRSSTTFPGVRITHNWDENGTARSYVQDIASYSGPTNYTVTTASSGTITNKSIKIELLPSGGGGGSTVTLQNGLNSYAGCTDSYMNAAATTTNYGTNTKLSICGYADQGSTNRLRPTVRFDLSGITPGTTVNNATLYVYAYDQTAWRGDTGYYGIYPLTRSFNESQVTWNIAATGTNWTTAGGDFNATADATASKRASASVWYAFNVTSRVQGWVNSPSSNYGWLLKCTDENLHNQDNFTSSNNADTTHRPKLVVNDTVVPDMVAPAAVSSLASSSPTSSSVTLSWDAPGDDGSSGTATSYDIRYATSTITEANWAGATQVSGEPTPATAGTLQTKVVTGLTASTTYYFAIKAMDEAYNVAALSNVPTGTTTGGDSTAPAAVANLATSNPTTSSITLSWTAPGDDNSTGTATTYDIRYSTSTITSGNWASATQVTGEPAPAAAGTNQNMTVTGLNPNTTYYFAIETADEVPNWSALSNVPSGTTAGSQIRTVGSGYTYATVQAAVDAASDGDTIQIYAGTYTQSAGWASIAKHSLTIVGMGLPKPVLDANGSCLSGKGIFIISGNNTTVQNLEFKNARNTVDLNASGIRQEGSGLTVQNCYFHDNDNGMLINGVAGSNVTVETSEFNHNGYGNGSSHNIYVNAVDSFTLRYCYMHNAYAGHEVKTRAAVNYILYNRIGNEGGNGSYEVQLANGGTSYVLGNQIEQSSTTGNPIIIDYGTEGSSADNHLYVVNNTIVNNKASGTFVNNSNATSALLMNNIFQGTGTVLVGAGTQTTNLTTANAYLADVATYYYYLTAASTGALNVGSTPGSGINGFSMCPIKEYVHPCQSQNRPSNGTLDIGAYEWLRTFQTGVNSYAGCTDSYMNAAAATTNYGTNTKLSVCGYADGGLTNRIRPIVRFDVSSIPTTTTITGATLYVYAYDQAYWRGSSSYYSVYPLTRAFTESQVTWNIAATGTNWTTAGGDFNATPDANVTKQGQAGVWYALDVTSRVQAWITTPSSNYGWVLKCTDENAHNQDNFTSANNTDVVHRPKLVITGY